MLVLGKRHRLRRLLLHLPCGNIDRTIADDILIVAPADRHATRIPDRLRLWAAIRAADQGWRPRLFKPAERGLPGDPGADEAVEAESPVLDGSLAAEREAAEA